LGYIATLGEGAHNAPEEMRSGWLTQGGSDMIAASASPPPHESLIQTTRTTLSITP